MLIFVTNSSSLKMCPNMSQSKVKMDGVDLFVFFVCSPFRFSSFWRLRSVNDQQKPWTAFETPGVVGYNQCYWMSMMVNGVVRNIRNCFPNFPNYHNWTHQPGATKVRKLMPWTGQKLSRQDWVTRKWLRVNYGGSWSLLGATTAINLIGRPKDMIDLLAVSTCMKKTVQPSKRIWKTNTVQNHQQLDYGSPGNGMVIHRPSLPNNEKNKNVDGNDHCCWSGTRAVSHVPPISCPPVSTFTNTSH